MTFENQITSSVYGGLGPGQIVTTPTLTRVVSSPGGDYPLRQTRVSIELSVYFVVHTPFFL